MQHVYQMYYEINFFIDTSMKQGESSTEKEFDKIRYIVVREMQIDVIGWKKGPQNQKQSAKSLKKVSDL